MAALAIGHHSAAPLPPNGSRGSLLSSVAGAAVAAHATLQRAPTAGVKRVSEIIFVVEDAPDGGLVAKAVGASIVTEADSMTDLRDVLRDAVRCHFEEADRPQLIRIHYVRDEVIAA